MTRFLALLLLPFLVACATVTTSDAPAAFSSDRISVEVRGSGPDVVLIPGLSSSPEVWESSIAAVPGYRYHLIQVKGFSGTPPEANANGAVVVPIAEEIARYVTEAGLEKPALVGHSLGGSWAMLVAARHPDLAGKLMVVDMLPFMGAMFGPPGATAQSVEPIAAQIRQGIQSSSGEPRRQIVTQTIATMVKTESRRPRAVEQSLSSDAKVSGQAMYDLITLDLRPELKAVKVPLTVLWVLPPGAPINETQMRQFYALSYANTPQAMIKQIPDSYHFIMLDQPEAFQRELKAFLGS